MRRSSFLPLLALAAALPAQDAYPLPASAPPGSRNGFETTAPFLAPIRMAQVPVTNRATLTLQGLPLSFGKWDMSCFDPTGRFLFTPSEVGDGGGVFRYDTATGAHVVLMAGVLGAPRTANPAVWTAATDNFVNLDPCTWTPFGTVLTGEETTGGRMFEVQNPLANGPFQVRWLSRIPAVAHEGVRLDRHGSLYFVDEDASGSIYKFTPSAPGNLANGQSFVLRVDAYASSPTAAASEPWDSASNRLNPRFGPAHWVPLTDGNGVPLTASNPFAYVTTTGGRTAADEVVGTPYGRPEDMDVGVLANGNECLYVTTCNENRVLAIELTGGDAAVVHVFCDFDTVNLATGRDVNPLQNDPYTSPGPGTVFAVPDNLAVDAWGSVYVVEDNEPNGGDVWKCVDADRNGVAEAMGLFLSLGVSGSEPTGMVFHPTQPYWFLINVQHPASGNDATWAFSTRPYGGSDRDLTLRTGVNRAPTEGPGEFVKAAAAADRIGFALASPQGALTGRPFALALQLAPTATGAPPYLPPLWLHPQLPLASLAGHFASPLPANGSSVSVQVPASLPGISVIAQGLLLAADGTLVCTDAHEVVLR